MCFPASPRTMEKPCPPVSHIIFPRYAKDGPTELKPLAGSDALRRLMKECLTVGQRLDGTNVADLVRWIAGIECYTLTFSSLEEATAPSHPGFGVYAGAVECFVKVFAISSPALFFIRPNADRAGVTAQVCRSKGPFPPMRRPNESRVTAGAGSLFEAAPGNYGKYIHKLLNIMQKSTVQNRWLELTFSGLKRVCLGIGPREIWKGQYAPRQWRCTATWHTGLLDRRQPLNGFSGHWNGTTRGDGIPGQ